MKFQVGDTVMHWRHGLGQITGLEERDMLGKVQLCYVVKMRDLSIWVPVDELLEERLRRPTPAAAFKKLFGILSGPAESLPEERRERKSRLSTKLAAGTAAARCQVIRDLTTRADQKSLNEDDRSTLQWARTMLLAEWGYCLQVPPTQAEDELSRLLKEAPAGA
ncbi:MAG: CarD family transcriptional regulator [Bacteroidota bacterium]